MSSVRSMHMRYLNMVGYHFHFITEDHLQDGHVLEVDISQATAQTFQYFNMYLPKTFSFLELSFSNLE